MENLDQKLNQIFPGCVVRKDLLHQIKKGTNVPSFVLEFLLAKYCATDDPDEIKAGIAAVIETLQKNYVRPDESNRAQTLVQQKGKHKFIDKVHVRYVENEKRHWAEMENFGSRRIAINETFYKNNDRLLEGGIWAEVLVAHNDVEDDDYAFYIEELRPIQLSKFDFEGYTKGRKEFTRDEWMDVLLRSIGLNSIFWRGCLVSWRQITTLSSLGRVARASLTCSVNFHHTQHSSAAGRRVRPCCSTTTPGSASD
jgi:ATP-dependent Lon protease